MPINNSGNTGIPLALPVVPDEGGTGVSNDPASTVTISGAFPITLTVSAATSLTLPTSGTVATTATFASPPALGSTTPAAVTGTTITAGDANSFRFVTDTFITRYAAKLLMISGDGTGTANAQVGWILGRTSDGISALVGSGVTAIDDSSKFALLSQNLNTTIGSSGTGGSINFRAGATTRASFTDTAGLGLSITAGAAATDVNALNVTQTLNAAGVTFTGIKSTTTWTAAAAGSKLVDIIQDSSSAFSILGVASGLNGVSLQVGATTIGPTLSAQGETNVPLNIATKGTGALALKIAAAAAITINDATATGLQFSGYGAGTITSDASGNLTAVSDERMKSSIRPFTRGLPAILGIARAPGGLILHGYAPHSGLDQTRDDYAGFGASVVEQFIPEAIGLALHGALSFNGKPITRVRGLADRAILAALVNAVATIDDRLTAAHI